VREDIGDDSERTEFLRGVKRGEKTVYSFKERLPQNAEIGGRRARTKKNFY